MDIVYCRPRGKLSIMCVSSLLVGRAKVYTVSWRYGVIERENRVGRMSIEHGNDFAHLISYGRTLSDASMLYFADVFYIIFYGRLSWPNG